ncbi:MAG: dipeptide ABC transporter ATP-binding protein [Paracoccaceae bacterium]
MSDPIIALEGLCVGFAARDKRAVPILRDVSLAIGPGETIGIVGESGSGKSTVALAMMGYLKPGLRVLSGRAIFDGHDMFALSEAARTRLRGGSIALIPQNAGQALTPTLTIGRQIEEALALHSGLGRRARTDRVRELLDRVRLPSPAEIATRYPHELSGGQQQRAAVAIALAGEARALLLDEPTTGLDVTTQAHILEFLRGLARDLGVAMVYVSHDLGVIARVAGRIAVMYAGELVEEGRAGDLLTGPQHPYTRALLGSIPRLGETAIPATIPGFPPKAGALETGCAFAPRCPLVEERCRAEAPPLAQAGSGRARCWRIGVADPAATAATPRQSAALPDRVLALEDVAISYARPSAFDRIAGRPAPPDTVARISFGLDKGETLGLVGESGSGKSTILRAIAGLKAAKSGDIALGTGDPLAASVAERDLQTARRVQMIFQNADASLNPRQTVGEILAAPLRLYFGLTGEAARARAAELLEQVRLGGHYLDRFPGQLSGGEKQRVGVARAFAAEPEIALCDEVTSALDVSVQAAALALLVRLQRDRGASYIFVSHDLAVVRAIADRVAVLYQGRLCEVGPAPAVYRPPFHPYTDVLLGAVLEPDPGFEPRLGAADISEKAPPAKGCPFQRRCPRRIGPVCDETTPPAREIAPGHVIHCHLEPGQLVD